MNCNFEKLSVLAYANNFTLWHYVTEHFSVENNGYFNNKTNMIAENDLIIVNRGQKNLAEKKTEFYIVSKVENGEVTVSRM